MLPVEIRDIQHVVTTQQKNVYKLKLFYNIRILIQFKIYFKYVINPTSFDTHSQENHKVYSHAKAERLKIYCVHYTIYIFCTLQC